MFLEWGYVFGNANLSDYKPARNQIFFINPQFLHHLSSFFFYLSELSIIFHAKLSSIKINKLIVIQKKIII